MWKLNWLDHFECISILRWAFSQVLPLDLLLWICWKALMLENALCLYSLGFPLNIGSRDSNCLVKQLCSFLISRILLFTVLYSLSLTHKHTVTALTIKHTNSLHVHPCQGSHWCSQIPVLNQCEIETAH